MLKYLSLFLIFFLPTYLFAEEQIAWITFLSGKVYCSNKVEDSACFRYKLDELVPVSSGFKFVAGDRIHVNKGSNVDIKFKNGSVVNKAEGEFDIKEDGIDSGFNPFKAFFKIKNAFNITSHTATVGVRGTEFFFKSEGTKENNKFSITEDGIPSGVYVKKGLVEVKQENNCFFGFFCKKFEVSANEQVVFDEEFELENIDPSIRSKINSNSQKTNNGSGTCQPCCYR